ncbi:hypothetical protein EDI_013450 [Entamoeba dispar SAW760]|uniref:Uncharacterized protein n=1 Tax=Entamoeba dispar (strain ATCC PRA-260 / SAW760) TaxID=370354 RepID=B0E5N9_ENTDS|nr:uncharacterized protein EDI_013450 [Entamoeba dispar SAW760]EDR30135.1 hypothetical protein EDI_013450 [Entamoeba dispar SAW760]|eukprot:EDR30135.1 hypothetical protein EDI_013450 [Entamoeba dispar SAW760]
MKSIILTTLLIIYSNGLTCVANSDGTVVDCDCKGDCVIDYTDVTNDIIYATMNATEYYLKDNAEVNAQNEIFVKRINAVNLTLSGSTITINDLRATNIWFNTHVNIDKLYVLGNNIGAEYKVNIYQPNEVHVNMPIVVNKIVSSTSTLFIMNDILTMNNIRPQIFVGISMFNVLPAFSFSGEKVKVVMTFNVTNSLLRRLPGGTCKSICNQCNAVFQRGLTQFNLIMTNETSICNVVNKGCQYNTLTQQFEDFNQIILGTSVSMKCDIEPYIRPVIFVNETTINNNNGINGSFVSIAPTHFKGTFYLKNLATISDVIIDDPVTIENVVVTNGSLVVGELIADQIIGTNITITKKLKTNTLVATQLLIKKNSFIEIPDGMVQLTGTTEIEENVIINFTQPKLTSASGSVSIVQAPVIMLDGNLTIHHPNIPMIIGSQQVIFGQNLNLSVIYHDEGFYNNCISDGLFLFKGVQVPYVSGGQYLFSVNVFYPPLNKSKVVSLIPNVEMCHKKGGDYIALMRSYFTGYDQRNYCQASQVVLREENRWFIPIAIVGVILIISIVLFIFFIMKYRVDKKNEVILD